MVLLGFLRIESGVIAANLNELTVVSVIHYLQDFGELLSIPGKGHVLLLFTTIVP